MSSQVKLTYPKLIEESILELLNNSIIQIPQHNTNTYRYI